jgi:hypothetical protein
MNKNVKAIIIIVVILVIFYIVYRFAFKNKFVKGYPKKSGEWVACNVTNYDGKYYKGRNTAGTDIYFKKNNVKLRAGKDANLGQCADAVTGMNVYTLK